MTKPKYDPPTDTFRYKIRKRLNMLSVPRVYIIDTGEGMPAYTPRGIRVSATRGVANDRIIDAAWPYTRRFILTKRQCKKQFSEERMERIDRMIEASNATCYSKYAKCVLDLKKQDNKDKRKKRAWSESERKKHLDYVATIAGPKREFKPPPIERGPRKKLSEFFPRLNTISIKPSFKIYKRLSKEVWYRNPEKVAPGALKYKISDRVKKLAVARVIPQFD